MPKKLFIVCLILCILALGLSGFAAATSFRAAKEAAEAARTVREAQQAEPRDAEQDAPAPKDVQYVLYLGTNDKDTNKPVFSEKKSREKAEEVLLEHFGGYTIQEANGGWIDEGTVYREYTLVIYLSDTDPESVHAAADKLIEVFHQSSVLIQANETTTEFYAGNP